ncbi:MAG: hypothetical protein JO250_19835 [Armatimonadetes bacterium]|nr:hypothetical protein [Armatimonadota bacterium]
MTINISRLAATALLGVTLLPAAVQAQTPPPAPPHRPGVNARLRHQDARVDQGDASGQLTRRESRRLSRRDARIAGQAARDRYLHNGHLTAGEHRRLNRELNRTSHAIYRKKHNDRTR